ncbi:MAG: hypothetical protein A2005_02760 [Desulfuromonadales bacterium GWC2_61_20]|nr:MAG: hypothetical protein A2005_02760 [Desulfuromonadales bacterium GWC2_61_20]HAD03900.1 hypothetical protein [Desulfuromonas sp.]
MKHFFCTFTSALIWRFLLLAAVPILVIGSTVLLYVYAEAKKNVAYDSRVLAEMVANELRDHLALPPAILWQSAIALEQVKIAPGEIDGYLDGLTAGSGWFDAILLVDAGRRVKHAGFGEDGSLHRADYLGIDLSRMPLWGRKSVSGEEIVWTDAMFSLGGGELGLAVSVPCVGEHLVGLVDVRRLETILTRQTDFERKGAQVLTLDSEGTVIFYAGAAMPLGRDNLRHLPAVRTGLAGKVAEFDGELAGTRYLGAVSVIPATGWVVLALHPAADVLATFWPLCILIVLGMVVALVTAALTAKILGRRMTGQLLALGRQAEAVAGGEFGAAVPPFDYQELNQLGRAIGDMAAVIEEREQNLLRSSEYYRALFHGSSDAVYVFSLAADAAGCRFLEVNEAACSRLGYSRDELLRMGPLDIDDTQTFLAGGFAAVLDSIRGAGRILYEAAHIARDGRHLPVEVNAHVIRFDNEQAVLAVARDVGERKQAEGVIHTLYGSMVETTGDTFFRKLVDELMLWMRADFATVGTYDPVQRRVTLLAMVAGGEPQAPGGSYAIDDLPCAELLRNEFCYHQSGVAMVFPQLKELRERRIEGYMGLSLRDTDGNVVGILGAMSCRPLILPPRAREVLQILGARAAAEIVRQGAELSLVQSEARYRAIFDHAADALLLIDGDGRIKDANEIAVRLLDGHHAGLVGLFWPRLEVADSAGNGLEQRLTGLDLLSYEGTLHRPGASDLPVWISARRVELDGAAMILAIVRDLTERKQIELEMVQARQAAEGANAVKSQFLANISHEIRTPLNGVIGMLDLSLQGHLPEETASWLTMARASADALLRLINDLLDLSRIEAGKLVFEREPFALPALVRGALATFHLEALRKGLTTSCHLADGVPSYCFGDEGRIRQVLINLLGNACKFTEGGEITLRVVPVVADPAAGTWCRFEVSDSGIGIPAGEQDKLFQSFSQLDSTPTRLYGGSGLGLAISRQLVEGMGGRIGFTSVAGKGSTFFFELPLALAREPLTGGADAGETMTGTPLNLLIVEDNLVNRRLIEVFARKHGWRSLSVGDGAAALAVWRSESFDVVLMDVQMPVMDGLTATRHIRQEEAARGGHTPIVALTAYAMDEDRERCLAAGMDAFLHKPVHFEEFEKTCLAVAEKRVDRPAVKGLQP